MAAIGEGWVDGAWIEASWITGAWALVVSVGVKTANRYRGFIKNVGRLMH